MNTKPKHIGGKTYNIMAALEDIGVEFVRDFLVNRNNTVEDLSDHLKERYPNARGFSTSTIERFCKENNIKRRGAVSNERLDELVGQAVTQVFIIIARLLIIFSIIIIIRH